MYKFTWLRYADISAVEIDFSTLEELQEYLESLKYSKDNSDQITHTVNLMGSFTLKPYFTIQKVGK